MAIVTSDNVRFDVRSAGYAGTANTRNPSKELAREVQPALEKNKQQQQIDSLPQEPKTKEAEVERDSIRVSSTIGKAASSGQLSRKEAVAIYQEIANLL